MSKPIQLSILVPVYNVESYLTECLDSILPQLNEQTELILLNDCSTDNSADILQTYHQTYKDTKNIQLLTASKNAGLSVTRNELLKQAKGKYIWFVDSDDVVIPDVVAHFLNTYCTYDADVYVYDFIIWHLNKENKHEKGLLLKPHKLYQSNNHLFIKAITECNINYVWNKIYKKSVIANVPFHQNKKFEDIYFMSDIGFLVKSFCYINKPILSYRMRAGSIVNTLSHHHLDDYLNGYLYRTQIYQNHQMDTIDKSAYHYLLYKNYNHYVGMMKEVANHPTLTNKSELINHMYLNFHDTYHQYLSEGLSKQDIFRYFRLKRNQKKLNHILNEYVHNANNAI